MDEAFLAAARGFLYLAAIFLIAFDLPLVSREHKLLLLSLGFFFGVLVVASVFLATGNLTGYAFFRDYMATGALVCMVLAHVYWLNRRNKK